MMDLRTLALAWLQEADPVRKASGVLGLTTDLPLDLALLLQTDRVLSLSS